MSDDPLKVLSDIYVEQVKKADAKGCAEVFKACTEAFFRDVNEYPYDNRPEYHFEDVEYLDGYFIFGSGTNSIVHFHVKECAGWLFGIWWDEPDKSGRVKGQFFTQYEETLDKFKPSHSTICDEVIVSKQKENWCLWDVGRIRRQFDFIRKEPHLAFCRDYRFWDYNTEYHTREEADAVFEKYCAHRDDEKKYTEICDKRVLDFVRENVLPYFNGAYIADLGDYTYPKYEIRAPWESNKDLAMGPGTYDLFAEEDEEGVKVLKEFDAVVDECDKLAYEHEVYWERTLHPYILFYGNGCTGFPEVGNEEKDGGI